MHSTQLCYAMLFFMVLLMSVDNHTFWLCIKNLHNVMSNECFFRWSSHNSVVKAVVSQAGDSGLLHDSFLCDSMLASGRLSVNCSSAVVSPSFIACAIKQGSA